MAYWTTTTTYRELTAKATRTDNCPGCGKKTKRSRTFAQTVNPWNSFTNEDGTNRPKTPNEVMNAVREQADEWAPEPEVFRHANCTE